MPNRSYTAGSQFRYGFNGKENDNDVKGTGNQQDYGMRIYDPRIGKFLSVDPLTKKFSHYSPYTFAANSPVDLIDLIGNEPVKPLTWAKKIWYSLMGQDYLIRLNEFAVTNKIDESNIFYYNYENRSFAIIIDTRIDPYSKEPVEKKHVFRENYIRSGTISSLSPRNDSYYAEIDNYFDDEGRPIPTEDDQSEMTIVWGGGPGRLKNASTLVSGVALMGKSGSKIWTVYTFLTNVPKSGKYFGITIDYARRMAQHGARIIGNPSKLVENIPNKMTAKGIEQLFIEWGRKKGIITQQINSISKNNTQYDKALKLAEDFLKKNYGNKFDFLFSK
ncbi:RHS repeat domain-containing protein, partial [Paraflavitalea sp. sgz302555]